MVKVAQHDTMNITRASDYTLKHGYNDKYFVTYILQFEIKPHIFKAQFLNGNAQAIIYGRSEEDPVIQVGI